MGPLVHSEVCMRAGCMLGCRQHHVDNDVRDTVTVAQTCHVSLHIPTHFMSVD